MTEKICECGGKIAFGDEYIGSMEPDEEPFKDGERINLNEIVFDEPIRIEVKACIKCGKIHSISILNPDINENLCENCGKSKEQRRKNE